ncbi:hypothetical protein [Mangrovimonas sp. TPBH4]|nr:hypothetical protein [Mangrovimonas sp. TPBH4]
MIVINALALDYSNLSWSQNRDDYMQVLIWVLIIISAGGSYLHANKEQ